MMNLCLQKQDPRFRGDDGIDKKDSYKASFPRKRESLVSWKKINTETTN
jgi:hypothetical protein